MALKDLGQTDPKLVEMLTLSVNQGQNAGLQTQLEAAVKKGLIKDIDPAIVRNTGCVVASLWVNLVLEASEVEEFGEFYAKWANEGKIRAQDAYTTYEDQKAIARYYGYELLRIDKYKEFEKFINNGNGVLYGQLRIGTDPKNYNKGHNIDLYRYNGGWYGSDVGSWKNHGVYYLDILGKKNPNQNFRYFQFLIKYK